MGLPRGQLVEGLIRAGELEISGGDQAEIDAYFDTAQFRFHGPDGFETDYAGLTSYFQSVRAALIGYLKIYFPQMLEWFARLDTKLVCEFCSSAQIWATGCYQAVECCREFWVP